MLHVVVSLEVLARVAFGGSLGLRALALVCVIGLLGLRLVIIPAGRPLWHAGGTLTGVGYVSLLAVLAYIHSLVSVAAVGSLFALIWLAACAWKARFSLTSTAAGSEAIFTLVGVALVPHHRALGLIVWGGLGGASAAVFCASLRALAATVSHSEC
jgi:hypothetical protein